MVVNLWVILGMVILGALVVIKYSLHSEKMDNLICCSYQYKVINYCLKNRWVRIVEVEILEIRKPNLIMMFFTDLEYLFKVLIRDEDNEMRISYLGISFPYIPRKYWYVRDWSVLKSSDVKHRIVEIEPEMLDWCKSMDLNCLKYSNNRYLEITKEGVKPYYPSVFIK